METITKLPGPKAYVMSSPKEMLRMKKSCAQNGRINGQSRFVAACQQEPEDRWMTLLIHVHPWKAWVTLRKKAWQAA